ncbi:MAG: hypothetical protein WA919_15195 [Coleofasciculaceae cyanobacterium]
MRAVEQIEQDLAKLEEVNTLLAAEVHDTYSKYLELLGQAVRQQLIMASYRVCTQGYPDSFLSLSFNQRQQLQIGLKQIGGQAQTKLISHLDPSDNTDQEELEKTDESEETDFETDAQLLESEEETPEATQATPAFEMSLTEDEPKAEEDTSQLEQLVRWQRRVEKAINRTLQTISTESNTLLQEAGIIPKKLPTAVFEAAAKVEASSDTTAGSPNLMNLLMEIESDEEDSSITRIIAVNLRLPEIEFADPSLSVTRNQIHQFSAKAKTLRQKYRKKQRELAIAKAEAAWRACWFEE